MDEPDWNMAPKTVEELVEAIAKQQAWEATYGIPAPRGIMITSRMFTELAARILVLELKVQALEARYGRGTDE